MTDKERIKELAKKLHHARHTSCGMSKKLAEENWNQHTDASKEKVWGAVAICAIQSLTEFNSERIAELERENERLKNHIGESNKMVCNTKKPMYFQVKQKVREVGRIIGCGDEKAEEYEDDKMMELEQMFSNYVGLSQLQKENERLSDFIKSTDVHTVYEMTTKRESQLQKENSYLKEELEAISEVLPHHVGRNETGVSIIDDVKDLTKEALEFASTIKKLEKENSELKGKIERAIPMIDSIVQCPIHSLMSCCCQKCAKQTLSELKGEK